MAWARLLFVVLNDLGNYRVVPAMQELKDGDRILNAYQVPPRNSRILGKPHAIAKRIHRNQTAFASMSGLRRCLANEKCVKVEG